MSGGISLLVGANSCCCGPLNCRCYLINAVWMPSPEVMTNKRETEIFKEQIM